MISKPNPGDIVKLTDEFAWEVYAEEGQVEASFDSFEEAQAAVVGWKEGWEPGDEQADWWALVTIFGPEDTYGITSKQVAEVWSS
jgi:hypothetical protein